MGKTKLGHGWCVCFLCFFLLGFGSSQADSAGETLRVGIMNCPGYMQRDADGQVYGYVSEYLERIAVLADWHYEYIDVLPEEMFADLAAGRIDLLVGVPRATEQFLNYDYSAYPVVTNREMLCCLSGSNFVLRDDYTNLAGLTIACPTESVYTLQLKKWLQAHDIMAFYLEYSDVQEEYAALERGEADLMLVQSICQPSGIRVLLQMSPRQLYFASSVDKPWIMECIDEVQESIITDDPQYNDNLYRKYIDNQANKIAFTLEEMRYIKEHPVLTVALNSDMSPIEYWDEQAGCFAGITVDILKQVSDETGLEFRFVERPSSDELAELIDDGQIQIIGDVRHDAEAQKKLHTLPTVSVYNNYIVAVADQKRMKAMHMGDLQTIAVKSGYPAFENKARKMGREIVYYDSFADCVEAVYQGKVDAALVDTYSMWNYVGREYYATLSSIAIPYDDGAHGFGVARGKNASILAAVLNKALENISHQKINDILLQNTMDMKPSRYQFRDFFYDNKKLIILLGIIAIAVTAYSLVYSLRKSKKAKRRLEKANIILAQASQDKSDFLSRMSHEIRTPMNAIIGLSGLGEEGQKPGQEKDYFSKINGSAKYLLGLINDILDMSRIERGKIDLKDETVDIMKLHEEVEIILNPLLEARKIKLEKDFAACGERFVRGDYMRLEQIWLNLLNNAIKFSPEGGYILWTVRDRRLDEGRVQAELSVQDWGCGMSEDFQKHIFEPFTQESNQYSSSVNGTGLGMSIVHNMVQKMGGTIEVSSKLGKGTIFTIKLVLEIAAGQEQHTEYVQPCYEVSLRGHCILLVEDNELNREVSGTILQAAGIEVVEACNGQEAVDIFAGAAHGRFAAILMDVRMPVMDGLEATRRIRRLPGKEAASVPIVAMTADAFAEDIQRTQDAGMDAHLAKPVEPAHLFSLLAAFWSQK